MDLIGGPIWNLFNKVLRDAKDTFSQKTIILKRAIQSLERVKEDGVIVYEDIPVDVLINYNYMRTWPITMTTETGELDRQSIQIFFNKIYLMEQGLLTPNNNLDYHPDLDRFLIDGIIYKPFGDTAASQTKGGDIHFTVICKREENNTTDFQLR